MAMPTACTQKLWLPFGLPWSIIETVPVKHGVYPFSELGEEAADQPADIDLDSCSLIRGELDECNEQEAEPDECNEQEAVPAGDAQEQDPGEDFDECGHTISFC